MLLSMLQLTETESPPPVQSEEEIYMYFYYILKWGLCCYFQSVHDSTLNLLQSEPGVCHYTDMCGLKSLYADTLS